MPGDERESQFSDINLSDVPSRNDNNGAHNTGPWTHSTNSYSRKTRPPVPASKNKVSPGRLSVYIVASGIIFIVGLALGIVVGHFGIPKYSNKNEQIPVSDNSRMNQNITSSPPVTCSCPETTSPMQQTSTISHSQCNVCPTRNPDISSGEEYLSSPFAPLVVDEIHLAVESLFSRNLATNTESLRDNIVSHVYLYPQDKSLVLDYLDNGGAFPGRYAKVHVVRGANDPPDVMEYKVGPLNENVENITVEELRNDTEITFNQRPFEVREFGLIQKLLTHHLKAINGLLGESFAGAFFPTSVYAQFYSLPSTNPDDRLSGMYLYLNLPGMITVRILPVSCRVHHPGNDVLQWNVTEFYYLNQGPFSSGFELQEAYDNGTLRRVKYPTGYLDKHAGDYSLIQNNSEPSRMFSDFPPPITYEPEGPRYSIKGHKVAWMGWEFDFSSSPLHGPGVFDVKFKSERIAYEISLQDITLIYSSSSNGAGPQAISDTTFRLGNYNAPRKGVDCPKRARVLYVSQYGQNSAKNKPAACVFEANGQEALWRHANKGLEDNYLVLRTAMNLGNYDYTAEWRFHLDGSVETMLSASGYLYGAFWDPEDPWVNGSKSETPFGYRISDFLQGPIHDHTYIFKVDLDILGTNNSFETVNWKTGPTLEAFQSQANITEKPGFFYFNTSRYIEHEILEYEQSFVSDPHKPKYFTVVNENEHNVWGVKRGYRVIPRSGSTEIMPDHLMIHQWAQLQRQLSVTRRKDNETYGTESWYGLQQPTVIGPSLTRYLDKEPIRNTDLVLWVSEKFYHAPTAEDLPMTLSVRNGFTLKPHNYFDRTPVFDLPAHYYGNQEPYNVQPCAES